MRQLIKVRRPGRHFAQFALTTALLLLPVGCLLAEAGNQQAAGEAQIPSESDDQRSMSEDNQGIAEVEAINHHILHGWKEHKLRPSPAATEGEWCRRLYLDVIGRVPTVDELKIYLSDSSRIRRQRLVIRLLGNEYRHEFARNWATIWSNVLIGRTGGTGNDSLADREGMQRYLREAFVDGKPYDQMVFELITATGSCRPDDADFNGAANFLADKLSDRGIQAAAQTARIFLGMNVACTQCHNHPFNGYGQNQFWEFNAFFRQTAVERLRNSDDRAVARVIDRDFAGEGRRQHWQVASEVVWKQHGSELVDSRAFERAAAPIFYERRNGKLSMAFPSFIDGTSLESLYAERGSGFGNSGYLEHVHRRRELAKLVHKSPQMDVAIVNRVWAHFFGHGFTNPIDDIGPHNPPSHPDLLNELGRSFRASGYDLKELVRWLVLSKPYSLSSRTIRANRADDPLLGKTPMFSRFYLRQMHAEQLYDSLLAVTNADDTLLGSEGNRTKQRWLNQFSVAFGTDENDEATTFNGSIPQALVLMNSDLIKRATGTEPGSMLASLTDRQELTSAERIRHLYLAALSRLPTREEISISDQLLSARKGDVALALQDICWALLNCNEFILNH